MSKKLHQLFFHSKAETLLHNVAAAKEASLLGSRTAKLCNLIWERDEISSRCTMYVIVESSVYLMVGSRNAKHYQQFGSKTRDKKTVKWCRKVNADTKSLQ